MRDIQKVLAALGSPIRREILSLIWDEDVPAGRIAASFDVSKPAISQHLAVLREAGLVTTTVAGTSRLYRACQEALRGLQAAVGDPDRWTVADDIPERLLAAARTKPVVEATVDVPTDRETTFRAFTDPAVFSRWLGVAVALEDARFSCTMEWGTRIRGRYEAVLPPQLIAMRWDFDDDDVPVPGSEMAAYLRIHQLAEGSRVEVHQIVETAGEAEFMESAWTMVLGRLRSGVVDASLPSKTMSARATRPKRRRPA